MGLLNIIRRMALREKQSIREISRRTGLSRNTIAKYLSAGTIEPKFTVTAPALPQDRDVDQYRAADGQQEHDHRG
jgi:transcriptional regulator with XRE-family HTH domain